MPEVGGLDYALHGPLDGEPLLLSAGLGGMASYWRHNIPALAERYRVIAYDHRGTGASDRNLPDTISVADMAADILALLDGLGIARAHLLGHAAGGIAGLQIGLDAPERLGSLIVVNGWSKPDAHFTRCFDLRLALLNDGGAEAYLRAQPIFLYPARWIAENQDALAAETAVHLEHFAGKAIMEKRIAMLRAFDIDDRIGAIAVPTLLIAADDDMLVPPACSVRLEQGMPHAALVTMRYGAHACNVIDPKRFDAIVLDYLARHPIERP